MIRCFPLALAVLLTATAGETFAQNGLRPNPSAATAPATAGTRIGLIDISYIFKHHPGFKAQRDVLAQKTKALQQGVTEQRRELQEKSDRLKDFQRDSREFKDLEASVTQLASDYQVQNELARKGLMEEEVKLYHKTYLEVQQHVQVIADRYGIQLVMRFDREKMDAADPDSIRRGILNNVVHQERLDITDLVLQAAVAGKPIAPLR